MEVRPVLFRSLIPLPGKINSNGPEGVATASIARTPDNGSNGFTALFYIDGRMTSDYNTGSDLFPEKEQDGFTVVNARIGLRGPDQRWSIEFWGQNIFNTDYTQVAFSTPLQSNSQGTRSEKSGWGKRGSVRGKHGGGR